MSANGHASRSGKVLRVDQTYPARILRPGKKGKLRLVRIVGPVEQRIRFWQQEKEQSALFTREAFFSPLLKEYNHTQKLVDGFMTEDDHRINIGHVGEL